MIPDTFQDIATYKANLPNYYFKEEVVKELHPDKIDNKEFWYTIHQKFRNGIFWGYPQDGTNDEITNANATLHIQTGLLNRVFSCPRGELLDIGAGLCPILKILNLYKINIKYHAADLINYTKYQPFHACDHTGITTIKKDFTHVVCGNVIQHLSDKQIKRYIGQAYHRLRHRGYFTVGGMTDHDSAPAYKNSFDGNPYIYNFGQYTRLFKPSTIIMWLREAGFTLVGCYFRSDNYSVFDCIKE